MPKNQTVLLFSTNKIINFFLYAGLLLTHLFLNGVLQTAPQLVETRSVVGRLVSVDKSGRIGWNLILEEGDVRLPISIYNSNAIDELRSNEGRPIKVWVYETPGPLYFTVTKAAKVEVNGSNIWGDWSSTRQRILDHKNKSRKLLPWGLFIFCSAAIAKIMGLIKGRGNKN